MTKNEGMSDNWNTIVITRLGMCITEAHHCVPLWARTLSHVWASLELRFHNFLHFFGAFRNLELALNIQQHRPWLHVRSILDGAGAFVCSQVQSSRPSTLCARRMCKVCTEAVHSVALWTQVTWGLGMCKVCTEAVHCVALWTRVTLGLGMCKVCTEAVRCVALWTQVTLGFGHV